MLDPRIGSVAALFGVLAITGCQGGDASKDAPESSDAASAKPSDPATPAAEVQAGACGEYSEKLCDKAGTESPTCASIREVTGLMAEQACSAGLANIDVSLRKLDEARGVCDELVSKLCGDLGSETETCQMVKAKTSEFPTQQCTSMMEQYDAVLAELKQMEAKNQPLSDELADSIAAGEPPSFGPADASVTLVEFSDFQCPYCSRAAETVDQIEEKYGDQVRFVFRQFPLSFHEQAHLAGQASLAAHAQGKFWDFHDLLFQNQKALGREQLGAYAQQIGLDMDRFESALDDGTYAAQVDAELEMGRKVAVDGTPTLFINGRRAPNPTDFGSVSTLIEEELEAAKAKG